MFSSITLQTSAISSIYPSLRWSGCCGWWCKCPLKLLAAVTSSCILTTTISIQLHRMPDLPFRVGPRPSHIRLRHLRGLPTHLGHTCPHRCNHRLPARPNTQMGPHHLRRSTHQGRQPYGQHPRPRWPVHPGWGHQIQAARVQAQYAEHGGTGCAGGCVCSTCCFVVGAATVSVERAGTGYGRLGGVQGVVWARWLRPF
jgi:hypothetical protein